jgi:hypothetical protein
MEFALESPDGTRTALVQARPLTLRVKRGDAPGGEILVGVNDGRPFLDNRSSAACAVNGVACTASTLTPGDRLQLGALSFVVVADGVAPDVVEPATPSLPASDSDRHRQQRRISASRMAAVGAAPRGESGLLKRVSAAFSGRAERQRLEELESERRSVLIDAGRRHLGESHPIGLPAEALAQLQRGVPVRLDPGHLPGLATWREDRQRLVRLDAEIGALRLALGLGPDPEAVILAAPRLKSDEQAKVERAFATMDDVGTQDLGGTPDAPAARSRRR